MPKTGGGGGQPGNFFSFLKADVAALGPCCSGSTFSGVTIPPMIFGDVQVFLTFCLY